MTKKEQIKYDRSQYINPENLWTDLQTKKQLTESYNLYKFENDHELSFEEWLAMEQGFEQAFAIKV